MPGSTGQLLVINSGSSSLKFGVYTHERDVETLKLSGSIDSIGQSKSNLKLNDGDQKTLVEKSAKVDTLEDAFTLAMQTLEDQGSSVYAALGHRIVHGGPKLREHQLLTPAVLDTLKQAAHFAPLHDPPAIAILEAAQKHFGTVPQFVCLDTAFHTTLPEEAAHYPLPERYWKEGVQRYGFHGLSYESIVHALGNTMPGRTVVAHLGSGASLCAMRGGRSVDTSMGLTPTGGIPMSTRTGDLDPGVVLWLLRSGLDIDQVESLVNHDSGLKGLSNGQSDLRDLTISAEKGDRPAQLALEVFTRSIAKTIAGYAAVLDGLDLLVFTGGIGENSKSVREKVCTRLEFFGIEMNAAANDAGKDFISSKGSRVAVRIAAADEDGQIARHTRRLLHALDQA